MIWLYEFINFNRGYSFMISGSGGVAGLLSDYGVTGLMETATSSSMAGGIDFGATFCTGCKSRESALAVARCLTCANFLCSNCVMAHKVRS